MAKTRLGSRRARKSQGVLWGLSVLQGPRRRHRPPRLNCHQHVTLWGVTWPA